MTLPEFKSFEKVILDDSDFVLSLQMLVRAYTIDVDKVYAGIKQFFEYKTAIGEYKQLSTEQDLRKNLYFYLPKYFRIEAEKPQPPPRLPAYKVGLIEDEQRLPTLEERKEVEQLWFESMQRQFKLYKEKGAIDIFMPKLQYKWYVEYGLIHSNDHLLYVDESRIRLTERLRQKRLVAGSIKRNSLFEQIRRLEGDTLEMEDNEAIMQEAMVQAIKECYNILTVLKFKSIL